MIYGDYSLVFDSQRAIDLGAWRLVNDVQRLRSISTKLLFGTRVCVLQSMNFRKMSLVILSLLQAIIVQDIIRLHSMCLHEIWRHSLWRLGWNNVNDEWYIQGERACICVRLPFLQYGKPQNKGTSLAMHASAITRPYQRTLPWNTQ